MASKAQQGTDLGDYKPNRGRDRPRIDDKITLFKFPEKKWVELRLFGNFYSYAGYWVKNKGKDGQKGKPFFVECPSYDPNTQQRDSTIFDPWRDYMEANAQPYDKDKKQNRDEQVIQFSQNFYVNAIVRTNQRNRPGKTPKPTQTERSTGFKEKDSDSWTPVVPIRLTRGVVNKLSELSGLNVHENKKTGNAQAYPVSHPKYGVDIRILYDSSKSPGDQYTVSLKEKRTPLTEEELGYLKYDLSALMEIPDEAEVRRNFDSWATRNGVEVATKSKTKSKKDKDEELKRKKKKGRDDEDEDDEDQDDDFDGDDDDDEDDEPKSKKSKKSAKGKKKSRDDDDEDDEDEDSDDEDEDDDSDDEDEDEDDEPKSKKSKSKAKAKSKGKGKKSKDEDEDEDEDDFGDDDDDDSDDDEDEDEDDAPKSKKSKKAPAKSKGKKKSKDDEDDDLDDDDDEDEDEDEDEDDEPKSKKSKAKAKSKGKSKSKSRDDEEDEDDEDEDDDSDDEDDFDDEDEDDEPKKKSKKSAKPAKGKKKSKK